MRKELLHLYAIYSFQWGVSVAGLMLVAHGVVLLCRAVHSKLSNQADERGRFAARSE